MNARDSQKLTVRIQCELQALPELTAPDTLAARVMTAITRRSELPWYRRPWPTWPGLLRGASLALGLAFLGALWFAIGQASNVPAVEAVTRELDSRVLEVGACSRAFGLLLNAAVLVVKNFGVVFVAAAFAVAAFSCAACAGLGTLMVRLTSVRR